MNTRKEQTSESITALFHISKIIILSGIIRISYFVYNNFIVGPFDLTDNSIEKGITRLILGILLYFYTKKLKEKEADKSNPAND